MGNDLSKVENVGAEVGGGATQLLAGGGPVGAALGVVTGGASVQVADAAGDLVTGDFSGAEDHMKVAGYIGEQGGKAALGLLKGVNNLASGKFDFSQFTGSVENIGEAAIGTNQDVNDIMNPPSAAEVRSRQQAKIKAINTKNLSGATPIGNVVKSAYEGNNRGQVKPSDVAKISNPAVKMAVSSTSGSSRNALVAVGNQYDARKAPSGPKVGVGSSVTNNSGGDTGTTNSNDPSNHGIAATQPGNPPPAAPASAPPLQV